MKGGLLWKLETTANDLDPDFDRSLIRLRRFFCQIYIFIKFRGYSPPTWLRYWSFVWDHDFGLKLEVKMASSRNFDRRPLHWRRKCPHNLWRKTAEVDRILWNYLQTPPISRRSMRVQYHWIEKLVRGTEFQNGFNRVGAMISTHWNIGSLEKGCFRLNVFVQLFSWIYSGMKKN